MSKMDTSCHTCGAALVAAGPDKEFEMLAPTGSTERHRELQVTSDPPLDSEYIFIISVVSCIRRRLSRHDEEISRLRTRIEQREKERTALRNDLSLHTAIISPMRRMPYELLAEIFSLALPYHPIGTFNVQDAPWTLAQVCGRWKAVALSSPSLWSLIAINY
ncbi:hypothetical protein B0H17DRAFT_993610, partial [Mycena rosella]